VTRLRGRVTFSTAARNQNVAVQFTSADITGTIVTSNFPVSVVRL
jgi:hypothetical protein